MRDSGGGAALVGALVVALRVMDLEPVVGAIGDIQLGVGAARVDVDGVGRVEGAGPARLFVVRERE